MFAFLCEFTFITNVFMTNIFMTSVFMTSVFMTKITEPLLVVGTNRMN